LRRIKWSDSRNQWVGDDTAIGAEEGEGFAGPDVSAPTTRVIKQHIKTIKAILASGVRMCISQLKFRNIDSQTTFFSALSVSVLF
jgi:hypothetical protein